MNNFIDVFCNVTNAYVDRDWLWPAFFSKHQTILRHSGMTSANRLGYIISDCVDITNNRRLIHVCSSKYYLKDRIA